MTFKDLIGRKRDGYPHSTEEINQLVSSVTNGSAPDYQVAAWLMAAYLNTLSPAETADLTRAMAQSGERMNLEGLPKPWIDKHSTGGVGDKTTLVALPMLAACGVTAVKMSGRGLGITGGTIDKLESIPGFRTDLSPEELKAQAQKIGIALTGQTPKLAPADGVLYGLRDVTGTVANIPLIVSSILSKKIAGGAEVVVFDVKAGSGAFMSSLGEAETLAEALIEVGTEAGLTTRAVVSDMDQPLGRACGNALEVVEAIETLSHDFHSRFAVLCKRLVGHALHASGLVESAEAGHDKARETLVSGLAYEKAKAWFAAQGADAESLFEDPTGHLPAAHSVRKVFAHQAGWVKSVDARAIGELVVQLGGGRQQKSDPINHSVGVVCEVEVGDEVQDQELIAVIHAPSDDDADQASAAFLNALEISPVPVSARPVILKEF